MLNISPIFAKANKSGFTVIQVIDVCKWTPDGYYLISLNYHPQFIDQFTNFEMPIVYSILLCIIPATKLESVGAFHNEREDDP